MGAPRLAPRAVFDTNVVISALVLRSGTFDWLRDAWRSGRAKPVVSAETVTELVRTLGYPKFALGHHDVEELLAEYLPFADTVVARPSSLRAADPDDQPFLDLAVTASVEALVTGDAHLLGVEVVMENFEIMSPGGFRTWLEGRVPRSMPNVPDTTNAFVAADERFFAPTEHRRSLAGRLSGSITRRVAEGADWDEAREAAWTAAVGAETDD